VRTQQVIKFSLILSVFSIFIFSFTYFGTSAFSSRTSTNQVFSDQTFIGSIDISNKTQQEAVGEIQARVDEWIAAANIKLMFKGQTFPIDTSSYVFLIEESIASSENGIQNELIVEFKEESLDTLPMPSENRADLKKEKLLQALQATGQAFLNTAEINLAEYLPAEDPVTISTAITTLPAENIEIKEIVESISQIEIAPESQFSLADFAEEVGISDKPAFAYSQIASAIYKAILPTNFVVAERHISRQLPENIEIGYEAKVDFAKNMDLKFYNPNKTSYLVEINWQGQELQVAITGSPLLYEYKITASDQQEFKPRIIKQFSPLLNQGQKSVEKEGEPGFLLTLTREIYGQKGELLETEFIAEDFYPPVHRVEILPVAPAEQQTAPSAEGNPDTVALPAADNGAVPSESSDINPSSPEESSTDIGNKENVEDANESTDEDRLWGKPNEQPK
jgi:hypothetical protein